METAPPSSILDWKTSGENGRAAEKTGRTEKVKENQGELNKKQQSAYKSKQRGKGEHAKGKQMHSETVLKRQREMKAV